MPDTECQEASSASFSSLGYSILSRRRGQVHSMDSSHEATAQQTELESFQKLVAEKFHELEASNSVEFLSIPWTQKLLEVFLCIQEEFRVIVFNNKGFLNKPPMDRHMNEFFERSVKGLDVCNAIRDGIEQIRQWQKQLEIVLCALDNQRSIGEGQIRRAKKALLDFTIGLLDDKESNPSISHRNRSFGRKNVEKDRKSFGNFRSLSWSFSRSWSAAKQLQALGNNMVAPRANEITATNGLNVAVFTMSYVLLFVMWALVAAIPCQDRGLQTNFSVTRQFLWAVPMLSLHERILEESKKRDRKNACGLLKEIDEIEKCARHMKELIECLEFPLTEEKEGEARQTVKELGMMYEVIKEGLSPLDRQIREVFNRIVRSRTEGLHSISIGRANTNSRVDKI